MIIIDSLIIKPRNRVPTWRGIVTILILMAVTNLVACGNKGQKPGQSLVRVDGEEITILQLNDELKRARVEADQLETAKKLLLESLIDRQLILEEAMRNKTDRSPEVVRAIERAKTQIITQAYLENITAKIEKPTKAEVNDYYLNHPDLFAKRKEFILKQLIIPNGSFSDELRQTIDSSKSLDQVTEWMGRHNVQYDRRQTTRSSTDLSQEAVAKLLEMPKGQLFIVNEGENRVLNIIAEVNDSPVTFASASPRIEQFLSDKKMRDAAQQEISHLRSLATIEYFNSSAPSAISKLPPSHDNKVVETK